MFTISAGDKWAWVVVNERLYTRKIVWNKELLNSCKMAINDNLIIKWEKKKATKQAYVSKSLVLMIFCYWF